MVCSGRAPRQAAPAPKPRWRLGLWVWVDHGWRRDIRSGGPNCLESGTAPESYCRADHGNRCYLLLWSLIVFHFPDPSSISYMSVAFTFLVRGSCCCCDSSCPSGNRGCFSLCHWRPRCFRPALLTNRLFVRALLQEGFLRQVGQGLFLNLHEELQVDHLHSLDLLF